ncbi:hypothetical protein [Moraxella marmotae]|uniref:hypothetical protein n=1 Tax=Moraxella marmotae TaxID=3344520 RepID=UPI0035F47587
MTINTRTLTITANDGTPLLNHIALPDGISTDNACHCRQIHRQSSGRPRRC